MIELFKILSAVVTLYSLLCFVRIILTWIPQLSYSRAAGILASICDPYLNLFRGIRWLRMGSFDFSPALALCLLGAVSSILSGLSHGGSVSIGLILAMGVQVIHSIITSLISFVIIVFIIRLILTFINRDSYNTSSYMLNQVDSSISAFVYRIARTFSFGKTLTYAKALIVAIFALLVVYVVINIVFGFLFTFLAGLPF